MNLVIKFILKQKVIMQILKLILLTIYFPEYPGKIEATALSQICNLAYKNNHKVLLAGDSADEIFGGYHFHENFIQEVFA